MRIFDESLQSHVSDQLHQRVLQRNKLHTPFSQNFLVFLKGNLTLLMCLCKHLRFL